MGLRLILILLHFRFNPQSPGECSSAIKDQKKLAFMGDFFFLSFCLSSFSSVAMAFVVCLFSFWFACLSLSVMAKRTYIVQMNHHQKSLSFATHDDWYSASLQSLSSNPDDLLYTYSTVYHGFAAALVPEQAEALQKSESVLGVYEEEIQQLQNMNGTPFGGYQNYAGQHILNGAGFSEPESDLTCNASGSRKRTFFSSIFPCKALPLSQQPPIIPKVQPTWIWSWIVFR